MLAQMQSSQDSAVNARSASLDAVKQAEGRRLGALDKMANMAGQVRGQNSQVEQTNANIMNSFNQRLASSKNLYNQNTANTQNAAQQFNIGNEQQTRNANIGLRNQTAFSNMTRQEEAAQRLLDFQNAQATGQYDRASGLSSQLARNHQESLKDTSQAVMSTASAAGKGYSEYQGAEASKSAAADSAAFRDRQEERADKELDWKTKSVYNDTNRSGG